MKLSAIIIAKDAEENIGKTISSLPFSDEIIVIDNESSDNTIGVAKKHGAVVYIHKQKDFADQRNYGLEKAKGKWVLYVDTDEIVSKELAVNIQKVITDETNIAAYTLMRKNFYLGNYPWPYIESILRLFKKSALKQWYGQLHESPNVNGSIGSLKGFLYHYSHQNLSLMVDKTIVYSKFEAETRLHSHHPEMVLWRFPRVMISAFLNSFVTQGGWKAGTPCIIESIYQSFSIFITYARLWELQQMNKN